VGTKDLGKEGFDREIKRRKEKLVVPHGRRVDIATAARNRKRRAREEMG